MAKEQLKPMDVYATMRVPFDIATYCRGHRFAPCSVNLTRALRAYDAAVAARKAAEADEEAASAAIDNAVAAARGIMESDQNA